MDEINDYDLELYRPIFSEAFLNNVIQLARDNCAAYYCSMNTLFSSFITGVAYVSHEWGISEDQLLDDLKEEISFGLNAYTIRLKYMFRESNPDLPD